MYISVCVSVCLTISTSIILTHHHHYHYHNHHYYHQIVSELQALTPATTATATAPTHSFARVDGFDLESVKALAKAHAADLDYLVLTQGMATLQGYTPTKDGFDQKLQVRVRVCVCVCARACHSHSHSLH